MMKRKLRSREVQQPAQGHVAHNRLGARERVLLAGWWWRVMVHMPSRGQPQSQVSLHWGSLKAGPTHGEGLISELPPQQDPGSPQRALSVRAPTPCVLGMP